MSAISYDRLKRWLNSNDGRLLIKCILCVFAIGMAAHAYAFLGPIFSHDSMTCLYAGEGENNFKIMLGRIFAPLYRTLSHGGFGLPWLIGLLSLTYIGLSVYAVAQIFRMQSLPLVALTAGIFVTNATVSAMAATYIYELDIDMFALLAATLSAWCWQRGCSRPRALASGALLVTLSLGLYQSYISVAITLIMLSSIVRLLDHSSEKAVLIDGLKGIAMLIAGAALYFILLKLTLAISGLSLSTEGSNSLVKLSDFFNVSLSKRILVTYYDFARECGKHALRYSGYPELFALVITGLVFIGPGLVVLRVLFSRRYSLWAKLMFLALFLLLPMGMNFTCFFSGGTHTLMNYAHSLIYLTALLVMRWALGKSGLRKPSAPEWPKFAVATVFFMVLLSNIQASNTMYLKKDLDRQTTLSVFTRVADQMEEIEEYEAGTTPVAFCGANTFKRTSSLFDRYDRIAGMQFDLQVSYYATYSSYFQFILKEPLLTLSDDESAVFAALDEVQAMPAYPESGYVRMIDGTLVVKLS